MTKLSLLIFITILSTGLSLNRFSNNKISTLKLLQIIHRHGDRAPTERFFPPNDPYKQIKYWPSGFSQLTAQGRHRMYRLGQFIRKHYNQYLGEEYSAREVYARSSLSDRCIESVSCLLAGAYPPMSEIWRWSHNNTDLGYIWQPIPIQTFMPRNKDIVLNTKHCPLCDYELSIDLKSKRVENFLLKYKDFYQNLSQIIGLDIKTIEQGHRLHDTLSIEMSNGYYWTHCWTKSEQKSIVDQLFFSHVMSYTIGWERPKTKRLRGGGLVKELIRNMHKVLNKTNDKKLYVYSTHDILIVALLHALNIFDNSIPPFGASILVELHQKQVNSAGSIDEYFVRLYYMKETLTDSPFAIRLTDCKDMTDCPLDLFLNSTNHLIYNDFDKECQTLDIIELSDEENNQILNY